MTYRPCRSEYSETRISVQRAISALSPLVNYDLHAAMDLLFAPIPGISGATAFQMIRKGYGQKALDIIRDSMQSKQRKDAQALKKIQNMRDKLSLL